MSAQPHIGTGAAEVAAALPRLATPSVVTVGTFDGVHHGHRALLRRARELAGGDGLPVVAVTFSPRPDQVLTVAALPDICPLPERVERLRAAGADEVVVLPFSRRMATVTAAQFVALLKARLSMRTLCVGEDFALGRGREGDPDALRRLGLHVVAVPVRPSLATSAKASSSHVRRLIATGMPPELALRSA